MSTIRRRMQRPTLPPADEARLAATTADLHESIEESKRCVAEVQRFTQDMDSEKISMEGVVLEPVEDDDSLVMHVRESLRGLGA